MLARFQSNPSGEHWTQFKRVLRYLKGTISLKLSYRKTETDLLIGYSDADFGSDLEDRKSTSGYLFQIYGSTVSWTSRKQSIVTLSSTEAEFTSMTLAVCECIWLRGLLLEMGCKIIGPTVLFEDNQACISLAYEPRNHQRLKHIDIKYQFIKEHIENKEVILKYIPTNSQIADSLTKSLPIVKFEHMRRNMGVE